MQIQVKHGHISYESGLYDLQVGDCVQLPPLPWHRTPCWYSTVVSLGKANSTYDGPLKPVLKAYRNGSSLKPLVPVTVISNMELVEILAEAKVITVNGVTYTRREVWVRS